MYTDKVIKHFKSPSNMGQMSNPDAVGEVGNPGGGDCYFVNGHGISQGQNLRRGVEN